MIALIISGVAFVTSTVITKIVISKKREKQMKDYIKWRKEANEELEKIGWKLI